VVAAIEASGIKLLIEKKTALDRNRQTWIEDPDGNRLELMQLAPDSMQMEAIRRLRAEGR
jgi:lactoylglutathione lyase